MVPRTAANLSTVSPAIMLTPAGGTPVVTSSAKDNVDVDSGQNKLSLSPAITTSPETVVGIHASGLSFFNNCDHNSAPSLKPVTGELTCIKLQPDNGEDGVEFYNSIQRSAEEGRSENGFVLRRECVCEQFCEDDSTMSSVSDKPCLQCVKFDFDVLSVNRPCSNVAKAIAASLVDCELMMDSLRCVRTDDNVCCAKTTTACLAHCGETMFGMIKDGVKPMGLCLLRAQFYQEGGTTTPHQDGRDHKSELIVKIGLEGHFAMKRSGSCSNNDFLSLDCSNDLCINTTEAFHQSPLNSYCHRGGGNDSMTITFGSLDRKPATKEQSIRLMHFLCSLDHQLESIGFNADRTLKDLFVALNVQKLKKWKTQDLSVDKVHFAFMIKHLGMLGADFIKKPHVEQLNTIVFCPTKKRCKSVGCFLKEIEIKHWEHGPSAFEPDLLDVLRRIGVILIESQSTQESGVQCFFKLWQQSRNTKRNIPPSTSTTQVNLPPNLTCKMENGLNEKASLSMAVRPQACTSANFAHKCATKHWSVGKS